MKTTSIVLCMALAIGLLIGTLLLNHQQQASAQMGMMKPNMMNRTGMMGNIDEPKYDEEHDDQSNDG